MDNLLELKLIENGYDPTKAKEISLGLVEYHIETSIFSKEEESSGMILFNGNTLVTVESGIGSTKMNESRIAIETAKNRNGGLLIHSQKIKGNGTSANIHYFDNYKITFKNNLINKELNFKIRPENELLGGITKVYIKPEKNTKIFYLEEIGFEEQNRLFWDNVARQTGLEIKGTEDDKFNTTLKDNGIDLTMGTWYDSIVGTGSIYSTILYEINIKTEKEITKKELERLIEGLDANLQRTKELPSDMTEDYTPANEITLYLLKGKGEQVPSLIKRLEKFDVPYFK